MRLVLSLVCVLALVAFARAGDDTKKDVTLKGEICCAKCELKKQDKCNAVVIVKDGEKEEIYYFDKASQEKHGEDCCKERKMAKVIGDVTEKDGKKWISITKIEYEKNN